MPDRTRVTNRMMKMNSEQARGAAPIASDGSFPTSVFLLQNILIKQTTAEAIVRLAPIGWKL